MKVRISGQSDDVVDIDGDIVDEVYVNDDGSAFLVFDDGTLVQVMFSRCGYWDIQPLTRGRAVLVVDRDGTDAVAVLEGEFTEVTGYKGFESAQRHANALNAAGTREGAAYLKNMATVDRVLRVLVGRGFDSWWSDVDGETQEEIREALVAAVDSPPTAPETSGGAS